MNQGYSIRHFWMFLNFGYGRRGCIEKCSWRAEEAFMKMYNI